MTPGLSRTSSFASSDLSSLSRSSTSGGACSSSGVSGCLVLAFPLTPAFPFPSPLPHPLPLPLGPLLGILQIFWHSLLQQRRLKRWAIRPEAPLYIRRLTTIPPYDSSETITENTRVVAGRLRFSRRSPETTRRHWISTWICNPTQNPATSLRLFGGRLRLIGGQPRSSEIVSGMPKMVEKSCEHRTILISKIGTATGAAMPKPFATSRRRPESASDGCKIVRSVSRFCSNYPRFTHRKWFVTEPLDAVSIENHSGPHKHKYSN